MPPALPAPEIAALSIAAAGLIGWSSHRASLCNVRAVAEWLDSGTSHVMGSLMSSALWAALVSGTLAIGFGWPSAVRWQTPGDGAALFGALLFGAGAAVNGGCALSTLHRLVDGEIGMLPTLAAFAGGVWLCSVVVGPHALAPSAPLAGLWDRWPQASRWIWGALAAWALLQGMRLWRVHRQRHARPDCGHAAGHLGWTAVMLGLAAGWLFAAQPAWSYTGWLRVQVLAASAREGLGPMPAPLHGVLVLAVVAGVVLSAAARGQVVLRWPAGWAQAMRHALGGTAMGAGAALVPGGNDTLLLVGLPSFTARAVGAYAAMLVGIAGTLWLMRRWMPAMPRVHCTDCGCRTLPPTPTPTSTTRHDPAPGGPP